MQKWILGWKTIIFGNIPKIKTKHYQWHLSISVGPPVKPKYPRTHNKCVLICVACDYYWCVIHVSALVLLFHRLLIVYNISSPLHGDNFIRGRHLPSFFELGIDIRLNRIWEEMTCETSRLTYKNKTLSSIFTPSHS